MKKISSLTALLCLVLLFTNCSKDEETPKVYELNVGEIAGMIDKTPEQVKKSFNGIFYKESNTLGIVQQIYDLPTKNTNYKVSFKFTVNGKMNFAIVHASMNTGYSETINYFKSETDKIHSLYSDKFYFGRQKEPRPGIFFMEDRVEFWKYVDTRPYTQEVYESWQLERTGEAGDNGVYIPLICTYLRETNTIIFEIEKRVF